MILHILKTVNPFFDDVFYNRKEFEVRLNDRDFQVGDRLQLIEVVPDGQRQRYVLKDIKYILPGGQYGIDKDYVVLGLKEITIGQVREPALDLSVANSIKATEALKKMQLQLRTTEK
jgi:hypothetical protein